MKHRISKIMTISLIVYMFILSLMVSTAASDGSENQAVSNDGDESFAESEELPITDDKYSKALASLDETSAPLLDCTVASNTIIVKVEPKSSTAVVKTLGKEYNLDDKTSTVMISIPERLPGTYKSVTVQADVDGVTIVKNVNLKPHYNPIYSFIDSKSINAPYGVLRLLLSLAVLSK
ncbi:MAG: hypothetical protein QXS02_00565 [Candidatus Thermoplasmatota archaeon]